jgi:hypothetical protein
MIGRDIAELSATKRPSKHPTVVPASDSSVTQTAQTTTSSKFGGFGTSPRIDDVRLATTVGLAIAVRHGWWANAPTQCGRPDSQRSGPDDESLRCRGDGSLALVASIASQHGGRGLDRARSG